ncbi:MAG: hypothetical protein CMP20_12305 [Rickettsiales bacterium]|nr:hypothetical protein [Rickettsiales bacterium]
MSLAELQLLDREAKDETHKSRNCELAKELLASMRKGPHSLSDALDKVAGRWNYGSDEVAKNELHAVLNEMAADIYRIAEMRLAAKARFHKTQAAQKSAIVTASILPLPELEKDNA